MSVKPTAADTSTLNLVVFRNRYYPLADPDFTLMREHKVTVGCITEVALTVLRKTLFKGLKIVEHRWGSVYEQLIEQFKQSFPDNVPWRFKAEDNWIIVRVPERKDPEAFKALVQLAQDRVSVLRKYAGRYGFSVKSMTKDRDGSMLIRAAFVADPEIVPSHHFRTPDLQDNGLRMNLHLAQSCRLVLESKKSPIGVPTVKTLFQDRFGDEWKDGFVRAFELHRLSADEITAAIGFFSDLLILQQALKKTK